MYIADGSHFCYWKSWNCCRSIIKYFNMIFCSQHDTNIFATRTTEIASFRFLWHLKQIPWWGRDINMTCHKDYPAQILSKHLSHDKRLSTISEYKRKRRIKLIPKMHNMSGTLQQRMICKLSLTSALHRIYRATVWNIHFCIRLLSSLWKYFMEFKDQFSYFASYSQKFT